MDGRGARLERARQVGRLIDVLVELPGREPDELVDAVALALRDRRLPHTDLGRGGRDPEPPAAAEVGVDAVLGAERLDAVDGLLGGPRDPHALLLAARLDQRPELRPPGRQEAAVSPAGTGAADVGLDDGDVAAGLELLDPKRGPETRVAAADDADVGRLLAFQRSRRPSVVDGERLLEPERTVHGRGFLHSGRFGAMRERAAIVTGGGTGIGRAAALALHRDGFNIVIAGRRPEPLEGTRELAGDGCVVHPGDIREREVAEALVERCLAGVRPRSTAS